MFYTIDEIFENYMSVWKIVNWQLSNYGFFLENQRQFFHGTK